MFLPYILSKASGSCSRALRVKLALAVIMMGAGLGSGEPSSLYYYLVPTSIPSQAESAPFNFKLLGVRVSSRTSFTRHVVMTGDVRV